MNETKSYGEKEKNFERIEINVNPARLKAAQILNRFERSDAYLDKLLKKELDSDELSPRDKALLVELVNGVVRWRWKLDWGLIGFYKGDFLKCLNIVKNALRIAYYQIMFLDRIPVYAAINESVEIVKKIQGEKTANLVNGVLRSLSRNVGNIRYPIKEEDPIYYYAIMASHPRWMVKKWAERFDDNELWRLLKANNRRPFTPLKTNSLKAEPKEIAEYLEANGIYFEPSPYAPEVFQIKTRGINPADLEIFQEGKATVQDASAWLATKLAAPQKGSKIVDLCAAPGGKSFGLAELIGDEGEIYAIDKYSSKLRFIEEGAKRLGFSSIKTTTADAENLDFDEEIDLAFLDAPCSGLGVLSKKPDIKWKREREDILKLTATQERLLDSAAKITKPGGVIVYSTCTIEPEENEETVAKFLSRHPEFKLDPAENYLPKSVCKDGFMQTMPHIHFIDGAFAARLVKEK